MQPLRVPRLSVNFGRQILGDIGHPSLQFIDFLQNQVPVEEDQHGVRERHVLYHAQHHHHGRSGSPLHPGEKYVVQGGGQKYL